MLLQSQPVWQICCWPVLAPPPSLQPAGMRCRLRKCWNCTAQRRMKASPDESTHGGRDARHAGRVWAEVSNQCGVQCWSAQGTTQKPRRAEQLAPSLQRVAPVGLRRMGPKGQALWTNALCTTQSWGLQNPGSPEQSPAQAGSTRLQQLTLGYTACTAGPDEQPLHRGRMHVGILGALSPARDHPLQRY